MKRYRRQTSLKEIDENDQEELGKKSVVIVGIGGLGSTIVNFLTRMGIKKLTIIDGDKVKLQDLHRQIMYDEGNIGESKVQVAKKKLKKVDSSVQVKAFEKRLVSKNSDLIEGSDLIMDGSDNMETRYLLNRISYDKNTPWIYGSCTGTRGMSFNIIPQETPCFKCLISSSPLSEDLEKPEDMGTLNTTVSTVGLYQVTQAIKILLDKDYNKRLFFMDMWEGRFEFINVEKGENCDVCGNP